MTRAEATLVYDSVGSTSVMPASRAAFAVDRCVCYQSERLSVDLVVHIQGEALQVIYGQVFETETGHAVQEARVSLAGHPVEAHTDRHGEFALSAVVGDDAPVLQIDSARDQVMCVISSDEAVAQGSAS